MLFRYSCIICISLVLNKATPRSEIQFVFFFFFFPELHSASPFFIPWLNLSASSSFYLILSPGLPPLCCLTHSTLPAIIKPENIFHPHANHPPCSLIICVLRAHTPQTVVYNQSKRQLKLKGKCSLWRWMEGLNINWMRLT